ncbi:hypothetical protein AKAW_03986 [Aspergillus luchuensis IFO 4308]|nr:hypothetical protein AKAW_03986 [Aspergillus luchuensis IFO 4308]
MVHVTIVTDSPNVTGSTLGVATTLQEMQTLTGSAHPYPMGNPDEAHAKVGDDSGMMMMIIIIVRDEQVGDDFGAVSVSENAPGMSDSPVAPPRSV